jgi:hypothetical protein
LEGKENGKGEPKKCRRERRDLKRGREREKREGRRGKNKKRG